MKTCRALLIVVILLLATANLVASGLVGVYAIVEKVSFEPNDKAPQRMKVYGVFSFASPTGSPIDPPARGYLYFKLPSDSTKESALKEWLDLKALAGSGQAIAFGKWDVAYYGFMQGQPPINMYVVRTANPKQVEGLRAYKDADTGVLPVTYAVNSGIVKLEGGNYTSLVSQLKSVLKH